MYIYRGILRACVQECWLEIESKGAAHIHIHIDASRVYINNNNNKIIIIIQILGVICAHTERTVQYSHSTTESPNSIATDLRIFLT